MIRQNPNCCDGWEHQMPDGTWMCGKTHTTCENSIAYRMVDSECSTTDDCPYGRNCILGDCI